MHPNITFKKYTNETNGDHHVVSVVIPSARSEHLNRILDALEGSVRKPDEVLVVNDIDRKGASWARNQGIDHAAGDLIAFLDDDCVSPNDWLRVFIDVLDRHNADGVGGTYQESDAFLHEVRVRRNLPEREQVDESGLVATGGNIMYTKAVLLKLKDRDGVFFDEEKIIGEDWDLAFRLRNIDAKLIFTPNKVLHLRTTSFFDFMKFQFVRGKGIAILNKLTKKYPERVMHKSLLWKGKKESSAISYLRSFWFVCVGPFDVSSFSNVMYFARFWFGEKTKALGFLYQTIYMKSSK